METYKVVQRPSILVLGIEYRTSNVPEAGPHDIPQHWRKFYSEDIINQIQISLSGSNCSLLDYKK